MLARYLEECPSPCRYCCFSCCCCWRWCSCLCCCSCLCWCFYGNWASFILLFEVIQESIFSIHFTGCSLMSQAGCEVMKTISFVPTDDLIYIRSSDVCFYGVLGSQSVLGCLLLSVKIWILDSFRGGVFQFSIQKGSRCMNLDVVFYFFLQYNEDIYQIKLYISKLYLFIASMHLQTQKDKNGVLIKQS